MKWHIRDKTRDFELSLQRDPQLRFSDASQARAFLERFAGDTRAMQTLREAMGAAGVTAQSDAEVLQRTATLLVSGMLHISTAAHGGGTRGEQRPCALCPLEPLYPVRWKEPEARVVIKRSPPPQSKKQKPEKAWIEIQLLNLDGEPVAEEPYVLTLPDGSTKQGKLDRKGKARLDNVEIGPYVVEFPEVGVKVSDFAKYDQ